MSFKVFQKEKASAGRRRQAQDSLPQPRPFAPQEVARQIGTQAAGEGAEQQAAPRGHDFGRVGVRTGDAATAPRGRRGASLPPRLRAGIERLSGQPMGDVRVHYDSREPEQVGAQAHTAGAEIHLAPGQERHLAHEAWHAAQQKQGRVRATGQVAGLGLNEDHALEREADQMGREALRPGARAVPFAAAAPARALVGGHASAAGQPAIQCNGRGRRRTTPRKKRTTLKEQREERKAKRRSPKKGPTAEELKQQKRDEVKSRQTKARNQLLAKRRGYIIGQHGAKGKEQKRLSSAYAISVTGSTHESEHTIGFEPLNQTSGLKRGTAGRARTLENTAPAYQEYKPLHRDHIGTGTSNTPDKSGFNSGTYRQYQRGLVESGDISSAVQLNQLGYAFDPRFKNLPKTLEGQAANDSFDKMVENMEGVNYAHDTMDVTVPVDAKQRAEMYLSRRAAQTGKFPTEEEENTVRKKFGLPSIEEQKKQKEEEEKKFK